MMDTFALELEITSARRSEKRRKSRNNSSNQRPKLFRRQNRLKFFHKKRDLK
jgi:hypothetical protein